MYTSEGACGEYRQFVFLRTASETAFPEPYHGITLSTRCFTGGGGSLGLQSFKLQYQFLTLASHTMGGPNLEIFKFSIYLFVPIAALIHFGDPEWYRSTVVPVCLPLGVCNVQFNTYSLQYRDKLFPSLNRMDQVLCIKSFNLLPHDAKNVSISIFRRNNLQSEKN